MEFGLIIAIIGSIITLISAIVTVVAAVQTRRSLSLAENQNNQAIAQTTELKKITGEQNIVTDEITKIASELDQIQESLSTRYIGKIKDYLPLVVNQIKNAERSISILCDFPAYGYFTDTENYKKYRIALRDKIDNLDISVSLMCLDEFCRRESNLKVLSIAEDNWEEWKQNQERRNLFQKLGYSSEGIDNLRLDDFLNALERVDQEMLKVYCKGAGVEEVNALLSFDFWLVDGKKAIFAFSTYAGDASQYGFLTEDEKLISAFADIKERYHRKNVEDIKERNK